MNQKDETFKLWISEHGDYVYRVARTFSDSLEDRNDLIQEILVKIWDALPEFRAESRPSTWAYRIAINTSLNWKRSEDRRKQRTQAYFEDVTAIENDQSLLADLYDQIHELNKIDRSLILLHLEGFSYAEIARTMEMSESNVGVRLTRARKRLAERIRRDQDGI